MAVATSERVLERDRFFRSGERLFSGRFPIEEPRCPRLLFPEIIGQSTALKSVLEHALVVAPTNSTVLIHGETGTGKEALACAIHRLSGRRDRTFVKVNCAAIPLGLLESELFGHERGAFTGAVSQKIGRFELAHESTMFLDEVGDIPLELQPKLLRVLQEREFERLGSTRTIRVNLRLIAATNCTLSEMVEQKRFRADLYYRFNVFPIILPPLRERIEDIPLLVNHFVSSYAQQMGKNIDTIPAEAMGALCSYGWPGNIRELQNFIERTVILTPANILQLPADELERLAQNTPSHAATLEGADRKHILETLRQTRWIIGGPKGAATRLGLRRTTLISKMQKLGISRPPVA